MFDLRCCKCLITRRQIKHTILKWGNYLANIADRRYVDRRALSVLDNDRDRCCIEADLQDSQFGRRWSCWNLVVGNTRSSLRKNVSASASAWSMLDEWFIDCFHWLAQTLQFPVRKQHLVRCQYAQRTATESKKPESRVWFEGMANLKL